MLVFSIITLIALSHVSHKEERFMSAIFPLFAVSTSFFALKLYSAIPVKPVKTVIMKILVLFWAFKEMKQIVP